MTAPNIQDVPCLSCQNGYGREHVCDTPDYCACDQSALHPRATEPTPSQPAEQAPAVVPGTATERLGALHAAYSAAKAAADEANERLDAIKAGIKAELAQAAPEGATRILLPADPETDAPALSLTYSERATFDSRRFKREDPETYVRYAKFSGSWTLTVVKGGEPE